MKKLPMEMGLCYYIYAMYFLDIKIYIILQVILVFFKKCIKCYNETVV